MIGTLLNIGTVLFGGVLGVAFGTHLPERLKQTIVAGLGIFGVAYGLQMFLKTQNALIALGGLLIGGLIGEGLRIEDGLQTLGWMIEKRFTTHAANDQPAENGKFIRGFLTASLVFCVGPMAILGSIQDGLTGDHSLLIVKSILDGFTALAFSSSLGIGVLFSAIIILVYQGGISLLAGQLQSIISTSMMTEMTAVGGLILISIAVSSLLEIKKIRAGSFLPALIISPLIAFILNALNHY